MRKLIGFVVGLLVFAFAFEAQASDSLPRSVAGFKFGQYRDHVILACNTKNKQYYYVDTNNGREYCFRLLELVPFDVVKVLFLYNEFKNVEAIALFTKTPFSSAKDILKLKYGEPKYVEGTYNWSLQDGSVVLTSAANPNAGSVVFYFTDRFFERAKDNW